MLLLSDFLPPPISNFLLSASGFTLDTADGNLLLTQLHLQFIFMPTWKQCVRHSHVKHPWTVSVYMYETDREKEEVVRVGLGEWVGLSFVLCECFLQCSECLSCCSPPRPLSQLECPACIKTGGITFLPPWTRPTNLHFNKLFTVLTASLLVCYKTGENMISQVWKSHLLLVQFKFTRGFYCLKTSEACASRCCHVTVSWICLVLHSLHFSEYYVS